MICFRLFCFALIAFTPLTSYATYCAPGDLPLGNPRSKTIVIDPFVAGEDGHTATCFGEAVFKWTEQIRQECAQEGGSYYPPGSKSGYPAFGLEYADFTEDEDSCTYTKSYECCATPVADDTCPAGTSLMTVFPVKISKQLALSEESCLAPVRDAFNEAVADATVQCEDIPGNTFLTYSSVNEPVEHSDLQVADNFWECSKRADLNCCRADTVDDGKHPYVQPPTACDPGDGSEPGALMRVEVTENQATFKDVYGNWSSPTCFAVKTAAHDAATTEKNSLASVCQSLGGKLPITWDEDHILNDDCNKLDDGLTPYHNLSVSHTVMADAICECINSSNPPDPSESPMESPSESAPAPSESPVESPTESAPAPSDPPVESPSTSAPVPS